MDSSEVFTSTRPLQDILPQEEGGICVVRDEASCLDVVVTICEHDCAAAKQGMATHVHAGVYCYADVVLSYFCRYRSTTQSESPTFELRYMFVYTRYCVAGSPVLSLS